MKFCRDCKHFCNMPMTVPLCTHPSSYQEPVYGYRSTCMLMRSGDALVSPVCGPEAQWFEEQPQPEPPPSPSPLAQSGEQPDLSLGFWTRVMAAIFG